MRPRHMVGIVSLLLVATLCVACGSTKKASTTAGSAGPSSTALGQGVTDKTVKLGVALVDFNCIKQFVDGIRVNQQQIYQAYINDLNAHGGVAGRQIVPVFDTYCPIGNAQALALCTKFTEDAKVFAVTGTFNDFSGDAQTCLAKNHHTPLITFDLSDAIINQSPPGYIIYAGASPERIDSVLLELLKKQHTLNGKKVAVLGETTSQSTVTSSVEPTLKKLGVQTGSTAILSVGGTDTSAAQSQLDSFIERWKSEHVDALFVTGTQVSSKQFMEKVRGQMPNVMLVTDIQDTKIYGQGEQQSGRRPNPYEGILTAVGPTDHEYDQSANWKFCADIYQHQLGNIPPNAEAVQPKGPDGKTLDTYGVVNDACQVITVFHDVAVRVGRSLNAQNWAQAVNSYGPIRNVGGGQYASVRSGKYDIDDTFRLAAFDSSIPPYGQWRPVTPLENITG